ncbi:MAG: hypothetical protein KJ070_01055 [Verrucomicrobia bacterium]|nr:hypothetical protein [Verrucomicrobiota bacterium]
MKYTVRPVNSADCACPGCRAGKHLYELHRWAEGQWTFVGVSLQGYASADDCKQSHWWGIEFRAEDTWEDGTPITSAEHMEKPASGTGHKVILDTAALQKSAEALERHWMGDRREDPRPKEG